MAQPSRFRPGTVFLAAVVAGVGLAVLNALIAYLPGFPGTPPRDVSRIQFFAPVAVACLLFQGFGFTSVSARIFLTVSLALFMVILVLIAHVSIACSFGDCF